MPALGYDDAAARAAAAFKAKEYHLAVDLYTTAIGATTDDEELARVLVNRSNAFSQLRKYEESRADAQRALLHVPFHSKAL